MNRRNQEIVSDERLVAHLVKNYTYDRERGVVVNRKLNRVVKGCVNSAGYIQTRLWIGGQPQSIKLHHMVWVTVHGRFPKVIDHINGDKTDNRLENLREVTPSDNSLNVVRAWRPNARTGLPGVFPCHEGFGIEVNRQIEFRDKYEAFHAVVLLGRMFREM